MTATGSIPLERKHDPDEFGIEINYAAHSDAPSRVFKTMSALIEAFQQIDSFLAHSISAKLEPMTLLEDIETGSLKAWLRNTLEAIDEDALKSGEWKKVAGAFLVKAKRIMVDWTNRRNEVTSENDLLELQRSIFAEAERTGILRIPMYVAVPTSEIATSVELIANAHSDLKQGESVKYLTDDSEQPTELNRDFHVVPDSLTELLVHKSFVSDAPMILIIKKPDFLGDSKWEFRHGKAALTAKLVDAEWIANFRLGRVMIQPGTALQAIVRSTSRYGYDGEIIDLEHEIIRVDEVIQPQRPTQELLPNGS